jgi:WhiB family redox-sensing transcriptional regulator
MRVPKQFENPLCAEVDTELFFPEKGEYSQATKAKEICRRCPHLSECLEWAIPNERFGIWGATNERERDRMRTKLKIGEEEVA